jgi:hypothetical protein
MPRNALELFNPQHMEISMKTNWKLCLTIISLLAVTPAYAEEPVISKTENTACRSDAIRYCFFSLASSDATRSCLRKNVTKLSPRCNALIAARMKAKSKTP